MSTPPLILTLDIGTSSLRARLFDAEGRHLPGLELQRPYQLRTSASGAAELDAEQLLETTFGALDAVLAQAGQLAGSIGAVAISLLAGNMLGVDAAGKVLTPLYTYADTRGAAAVAELRARLDERAVFERTGCPLRASYLPALLLWLRQSQPELMAPVSRWLFFGDLLFLRLFGTPLASQSLAAWSGLLNRHSGRWDAELLAAVDLNEGRLPLLAADGQTLSGLCEPWASRWPALARIPWLPAAGDGVCSNVGCGCLGPERLALAVGTSGALRLLLEQPVERLPWGLWAYRASARRSLLGGALNNGGNMLAWLRQTLAGAAGQLDLAVGQLAPDAHGLTVLPFLAGERSPSWDSGASATISGLRLSSTPAEIARACMEAVAYRFALLLELLRPLAGQSPEIVASGGAMTSSRVWPQMMADVLGLPVRLAAAEASSRGAALLALEALGVLGHAGELAPEPGPLYQPQAEHHRRYQQGLERHRALYRQLIGDYE